MGYGRWVGKMGAGEAIRGAIGMVIICFMMMSGVNGQNACEIDCVKEIYANNCGQASCITGISSSNDYDSLCGPACISAISGGSMLDCLTSIGGSIQVQNSFVLTVQNFCAQGDPFKPVMHPPAPSPDLVGPALVPAPIPEAPPPSSESLEDIFMTAEPLSEIDGVPEPDLQFEELMLKPSEFL